MLHTIAVLVAGWLLGRNVAYIISLRDSAYTSEQMNLAIVDIMCVLIVGVYLI